MAETAVSEKAAINLPLIDPNSHEIRDDRSYSDYMQNNGLIPKTVLVIDTLNLYRSSLMGLCKNNGRSVFTNGGKDFTDMCKYISIMVPGILDDHFSSEGAQNEIIVDMTMKLSDWERGYPDSVCDHVDENNGKQDGYLITDVFSVSCTNSRKLKSSMLSIINFINTDPLVSPHKSKIFIKFSIAVPNEIVRDIREEDDNQTRERLQAFRSLDDILALKKLMIYGVKYPDAKVKLIACDKQVSNTIPPVDKNMPLPSIQDQETHTKEIHKTNIFFSSQKHKNVINNVTSHTGIVQDFKSRKQQIRNPAVNINEVNITSIDYRVGTIFKHTAYRFWENAISTFSGLVAPCTYWRCDVDTVPFVLRSLGSVGTCDEIRFKHGEKVGRARAIKLGIDRDTISGDDLEFDNTASTLSGDLIDRARVLRRNYEEAFNRSRSYDILTTTPGEISELIQNMENSRREWIDYSNSISEFKTYTHNGDLWFGLVYGKEHGITKKMRSCEQDFVNAVPDDNEIRSFLEAVVDYINIWVKGIQPPERTDRKHPQVL